MHEYSPREGENDIILKNERKKKRIFKIRCSSTHPICTFHVSDGTATMCTFHVSDGTSTMCTFHVSDGTATMCTFHVSDGPVTMCICHVCAGLDTLSSSLTAQDSVCVFASKCVSQHH